MEEQGEYYLEATDPQFETSIEFLNMNQVLALHKRGIEQYSPGESLAVRDERLLDSAVMAPQQTFDGSYLYVSLTEMAAAYMVGLAMNHPFENGNKRVALAAGSTFLRINGFRLTLSEDEGSRMIFDLVKHNLDREGLVDLLNGAIEPL